MYYELTLNETNLFKQQSYEQNISSFEISLAKLLSFVDAFNLQTVKACVMPKIRKPRTMPEYLQLQIFAQNVNSHHR